MTAIMRKPTPVFPVLVLGLLALAPGVLAALPLVFNGLEQIDGATGRAVIADADPSLGQGVVMVAVAFLPLLAGACVLGFGRFTRLSRRSLWAACATAVFGCGLVSFLFAALTATG